MASLPAVCSRSPDGERRGSTANLPGASARVRHRRGHQLTPVRYSSHSVFSAAGVRRRGCCASAG